MRNTSLQRLIGGIALLLIPSLLSFTNHSDSPPFRLQTIVIDPGHGGKFTGASGKYSREQDLTLQISMRLGKAIEAAMPDVKVIYTRTEDIILAPTRPQDLRERINIANRANADLLISIHCNSMGYIRYKTGKRDSRGRPIYRQRRETATKGVETFVAGSARLDEQEDALGEFAVLKEEYKEDPKLDSNSPEVAIALSLVANELRKKSIQLASYIQDEYIAVGRVNRGFKEQSLAVLRTAIMPCVLTEVGFISNPEEEDYMNSAAGQNEIVSCLLKAIQAYQKHLDFE